MTLLEELTIGTLAAEIAPFITNGDDGSILNILERKDIPQYYRVSPDDFKTWCCPIQRGVIEQVANTPSDPVYSVALTLKDVLLTQTYLNVGNADVAQLIGYWLYLGKCTQQEFDALFALALIYNSNADKLRYAGVTVSIETIAQALRG
jgi:hypothetical protein